MPAEDTIKSDGIKERVCVRRRTRQASPVVTFINKLPEPFFLSQLMMYAECQMLKHY